MDPLARLTQSNFTLLRVGSATICALLIVCALLRGEPINPDALLYLQAGQAYLSSGFKASMAVYQWPFVPITIALTHQITHLSLEHSAYLLNIIYAMLVVYSFITLAKIVSSNRLFPVAAAIIITIYPTLNRIALLITRDLGYWTFTLFALITLLFYARQPSWKKAFTFSVLQLFAALYRIEGFFFLVALPFGLLFMPHLPHRFLNFLRCQLLFILLVIGGFIWLKAHGCNDLFTEFFLALSNSITHFFSQWASEWSTKITAIIHHVLSPVAKDSGFPMLLGGTFMIFIAAAIKAMTVLYSLLSIYGMKCHAQKKILDFSPILITFLIVNILITMWFVIKCQFLVPRYVVPLCFLLLLFAAQGLLQIFQSSHKIIKIIVAFILMITLITDVIHTGPSKRYVISAGEWLKQLPTSTSLFSNSSQVIYYAGRPFDYKNTVYTDAKLNELVKKHRLHQYHYIAVNISHRDVLPITLRTLKPAAVFNNPRGDKILIFNMSS